MGVSQTSISKIREERIVDGGGAIGLCDVRGLEPRSSSVAESPDSSPHTSAFDRIEAGRGKEMESAAFDLIPMPTEEAAKEIRETPVDKLREKRKEKRRNPTGRRVKRDGWLSPLTLEPAVLSSDAQAHRDGFRSSDKGFLHLSLRAYLRLLRWTAKQSVDGIVSQVPRSLAGTLRELGIDASMWRDLVWHWQKYFGQSSCVGRPESMQADAERHGKEWHRGQKSASVCFT